MNGLYRFPTNGQERRRPKLSMPAPGRFLVHPWVSRGYQGSQYHARKVNRTLAEWPGDAYDSCHSDDGGISDIASESCHSDNDTGFGCSTRQCGRRRQQNKRRNRERDEHLLHIRANMDITEQELQDQLLQFDDRDNQDPRDRSEWNEDSSENEDRDMAPEGPHSYFDDKLVSPTKALLLFYLNSGLMRFHKHRDYMSCYHGKPIDKESLIAEIRQDKLSELEMTSLVQNFLTNHNYNEEKLIACGCCGQRMFERCGEPTVRFSKLLLGDGIAKPLQYDVASGELGKLLGEIENPATKVRIPINENWEFKDVELWKLRSIYVQTREGQDPVYWHLHPELVDRDENDREFTMACSRCMKTLKKDRSNLTLEKTRPPLSVARGVDFGCYNRLDLETPNLLELQILSRTRMFFATIKVSSNMYGIVNGAIRNRYKCHAVVFPHDAQRAASFMFKPDIFAPNGMLDEKSLRGLLQVMMLDHKQHADLLFRHIFGTDLILARAWVIAQWLTVMKWSNPHCSDLELGDLRRTQDIIDRLNKHIKKTVSYTDDRATLAYEQQIGADIASVAHDEVRADWEVQRRDEEVAAVEEEGDLRNEPMTYTFVTPSERGYLLEDPKYDFRARALKRLSEMGQDEVNRTLCSDEAMYDELFDKEDEVDRYLQQYPEELFSASARAEMPLAGYTGYNGEDVGLATCFPHVFMLGKAYGKQAGRLTLEERRHLLGQYTLIPAHDRRLMGFLFDMMQRMKVFDGVKAYIDGNARALQKIRCLLEDPDERAALKVAMSYPYSDKSRRVFDKYYCHLRCAGKSVQYGAIEGSSFKHKLFGTTYRYSAFAQYLTLSPNCNDDPRAIRCTFRTVRNSDFPATFGNECPYGGDGTTFLRNFDENTNAATGIITLPPDERATRAATDPVAFVCENKMLLHDILSMLIGLPPEDAGFYGATEGRSKRRTRYYRSRKGIFGFPLCYSGVTEDHKKGTLHWHINVTAGPSDYLLQRFARLPEICDEITAVMDTMYRSKLPDRIHASRLAREFLVKNSYKWSIDDDVPSSLGSNRVMPRRARLFRDIQRGINGPLTRRRMKLSVEEQGGAQNRHSHQQRCRQLPRGLHGCALDHPQACCATTHPVLLVPRPTTNRQSQEPDGTLFLGGERQPCGGYQNMEDETNGTDDEDDGRADDIHYDVLPVPSLEARDRCETYKLAGPLCDSQDDGVIVWETERPVIVSTQFITDISDVSDIRGHVVSAFRSILQEPEGGREKATQFWEWLQHKASFEQLGELYNYVKEKLPMANGYVASFNPTLAFCTSSHNNTSPLGSMTQAKSALFYIIPYETKKKVRPEHCLPILEDTLQHLSQHESKADDHGTVSRTAKHYLQRVLNQLHLKIEVSDWQIAAALIDLPSSFHSDAFQYANPGALSNLQGRMAMAQNSGSEFGTICNELSNADAHAVASGRRLVNRWFRPDEEHAASITDNRSGNEGMANGGGDGALAGAARRSSQEGPAGADAYDRYAVIGELGQIAEATINRKGGVNNPERKVIFPKTAYYFYRGKDLADMTYYEYTALVQIAADKPTPENENGNNNNKPSRRLRFSPEFICHTDSYQTLRAKHCTPLAVGSGPPHPGRKPAPGPSIEAKASLDNWKRKADLYARYYLAYFRPMRDGESATWDDLRAYVDRLQHSNRIIDTFRLMIMDQHMRGFNVSHTCAQMARDFRARAREMWTADEKTQHSVERAAAEHALHRHMKRRQEACIDFIDDGRRRQVLRNWSVQFEHDRDQIAAMKKFSQHVTPNRSKNIPRAHIINTNPVNKVQETILKMKEWRPDTESNAKKRKQGRNANLGSRKKQCRKVIDELKADSGGSSNQQTQLLDMYVDTMMNGRDACGTKAPPRLVLLHGPPGAGKTKTRDAFHKIADICERYKLKIAFNNINAAEMGGVTTCSQIGGSHKYREEVGTFDQGVIQRLIDKGFKTDSLLTIEEFETNAPWHLARLNRLCQDALGSDEPFGGCLTLLIGDLGQLPPVRAGPNLSEAVMDVNLLPELRPRASHKNLNKDPGGKKRSEPTILPAERHADERFRFNSPHRLGANLMTQVRWYELNEQHRSIDEVHTKIVTKTYKMDTITMADLKDNGYLILQPSDARKAEWLTATALVATNREKHTLTLQRASDFAKHNNKHVIRWMAQHEPDTWKNKPSWHFENEARRDPCFYEVFVEGADGYICDQYMKHLRLINGTKIRYHSLVFEDEHVFEVKQHMKYTEFGGVITLPFAPIAVIVEVFLPSETEKDVREALFSMSLKKCRITDLNKQLLLPIYPHNTKWTRHIPIPGGDGYEASAVQIKSHFPLEPAFAITIHKALGRTLDRVILALSCNNAAGCNISYRQLHVSLSRVKERSHIRLLLKGSDESRQWETLTYLEQLRPDPSVGYYFAGFRKRQQGTKLNENWETDQWESRRANEWFRERLTNKEFSW